MEFTKDDEKITGWKLIANNMILGLRTKKNKGKLDAMIKVKSKQFCERSLMNALMNHFN
jgi:hypothetical protein